MRTDLSTANNSKYSNKPPVNVASLTLNGLNWYVAGVCYNIQVEF